MNYTFKLIFGSVLIALVIITAIYTCNKNNLNRYAFSKKSFKGIINKITFDEKKIPTVKIIDSSYYLGINSYSVSKIIQINDSIIKEANSKNYVLYRKDSLGKWQLIYGY